MQPEPMQVGRLFGRGNVAVYDFHRWGCVTERQKQCILQQKLSIDFPLTCGQLDARLNGIIQQVADEIKSLRAQEATAKAKLEKSTEVNSEIKRLCDWLDSHDTSFSEYDDMVIRRVVECIKVFKDGTIKVITKFGTEATETV